jgi:hypothetical protein
VGGWGVRFVRGWGGGGRSDRLAVDGEDLVPGLHARGGLRGPAEHERLHDARLAAQRTGVGGREGARAPQGARRGGAWRVWAPCAHLPLGSRHSPSVVRQSWSSAICQSISSPLSSSTHLRSCSAIPPCSPPQGALLLGPPLMRSATSHACVQAPWCAQSNPRAVSCSMVFVRVASLHNALSAGQAPGPCNRRRPGEKPQARVKPSKSTRIVQSAHRRQFEHAAISDVIGALA